jgi:hypothetical protein
MNEFHSRAIQLTRGATVLAKALFSVALNRDRRVNPRLGTNARDVLCEKIASLKLAHNGIPRLFQVVPKELVDLTGVFRHRGIGITEFPIITDLRKKFF